jgi:hypothetical protein
MLIMKSKPPVKKQTLKLKVDDDIRFRLIGISSHENDYRLVWAINNLMDMQFVRTGNLVVHNQKLETDREFSKYTWHDEDRYLTFHLISNRCPDGFLFPEIKNFDFLLQIQGELSDHELKEISKMLKKVEVVSATFLLQPGKIKGLGQILQE